jgi:hypothetical protein
MTRADMHGGFGIGTHAVTEVVTGLKRSNHGFERLSCHERAAENADLLLCFDPRDNHPRRQNEERTDDTYPPYPFA